jgi:hypothetical protein
MKEPREIIISIQTNITNPHMVDVSIKYSSTKQLSNANPESGVAMLHARLIIQKHGGVIRAEQNQQLSFSLPAAT